MCGPGSYNQAIIDQYRANGGKTNHPLPLLLLITKGAKSGETRTNPVAYSRDGDVTGKGRGRSGIDHAAADQQIHGHRMRRTGH